MKLARLDAAVVEVMCGEDAEFAMRRVPIRVTESKG